MSYSKSQQAHTTKLSISRLIGKLKFWNVVRIKRLALQSLLGGSCAHRQFCGFPSYDAAGNFADVIKSAALQQARGDGRPVAARAIDQQGAVLGSFSRFSVR